jgi:hypothetical protein
MFSGAWVRLSQSPLDRKKSFAGPRAACFAGLFYTIQRGWNSTEILPEEFPAFLFECEISSSHGGEYEVQICLLGCTAV